MSAVTRLRFQLFSRYKSLKIKEGDIHKEMEQNLLSIPNLSYSYKNIAE